MRPAIGFKPVLIATADRIAGEGAYAKWDGKPQRPPRTGELFISGARPVAYRARCDFTQEYFIAVIV